MARARARHRASGGEARSVTEPEEPRIVDPWTGEGRASRPLVSFPLKVLWSAVALLVSGLAVGVALPGTWEAERTTRLDAPPSAIFPLLDDPRRWDDWAPLGAVKASFSGPERGPGATRTWDDPEVGDGAFTIESSVPDREVVYRVEVQKGRMRTTGRLTLTPDGGGTRVAWHETGDFGRNPLTGYVARSMERTQGSQMEAALKRLGDAAK